MKTKEKIIKFSVFFIFLLLPIIDCIRRTPIKDVEILGISIIELVFLIPVALSFLITTTKIKKKELIPIIIYSLVLLIYIIFHSLNIINFDESIFFRTNINIIKETFYIIRTFYFPVLFLFVLYKNKDILDMNFYKKIIKMLIILISFSIVILNIFKLSFATYQENNFFIDYNIFDFYKSDLSYKLLSTRGWFNSANEISAILTTLLPINIYYLLSLYFIYIY